MKTTIEKDRFLEFASTKNNHKVTRSSQNAVIYTRVSSKDQLDNASLDSQLRICERYAQRKSMNVVAYFGGTFESAKTDERKEFNRMLAFVKRNKEVSYVICYNYTRFSRTGLNGAQISDQLKKFGITLVAATQEIDTSTPTGKFQERFQFLMAQWDNEVRTTNMTVGMTQRLLEGYWPLTVPFGYTNLNKGQKADKHHIVVNEQGKLLRKAWTWKIKYGLPNNEIVARLNKAGLKINEKKLSATFRNPFYCGQVVCSFIPGKVVEGKHEAMVSVEEWVRVIDILKNRFEKSRHSAENSEEMPLKRFMLCSTCGQPYTGYLQKQKNIYYYRCRLKGCCKNRNRNKLHSEFEEFLGQFEVLPEAAGHIRQMMRTIFFEHNKSAKEELKAYEQNLTKLEQKIEQLEERFIEGEINKELFDKYSSKFITEKEQVQTQIEKATVGSSNLEKCIDWVLETSQNLRKIWTSGLYEEKQRLQSLLFPSGIEYDRENGTFLTDRINCLFLPIPTLSATYEHKKTGSKDFLSFDPVKSG